MSNLPLKKTSAGIVTGPTHAVRANWDDLAEFLGLGHNRHTVDSVLYVSPYDSTFRYDDGSTGDTTSEAVAATAISGMLSSLGGTGVGLIKAGSYGSQTVTIPGGVRLIVENGATSFTLNPDSGATCLIEDYHAKRIRYYASGVLKYDVDMTTGAITGSILTLDGATVTSVEIGIISGLDQSLTTTSDVTFNDITITNPSNIYSILTGESRIDFTTGTISIDHLGLEDLTDPDNDRIMFWDETAGKLDWLIIGANLLITDKTLSSTGGGGGGVTSVAAGAGMDFTTITGTGTVTMGNPSTITQATINEATGTTHTHAWTHTSSTNWDDAYSHIHNLTTDIDHNDLTNTHNLSTDIDHDGLTNTHNLTTDINHDALTNFTSDEHFIQTAIESLGTVTVGDIDSIANYYTNTDVDSHLSGGVGITYTTGAIVLDLDELTTSTSDADGDFFAVVDSVGNQKKLTKGNIALSGFDDDIGISGTVASVSAGDGMDFTTITVSGPVTLGTPGTTTQATSNAITSTSHTHAWTHTSSTDWDSAYSHIHNLTTDIDHDTLTGFVLGEHFLQSAITAISAAVGSGIVITTSGTLGVTADNTSDWDDAYSTRVDTWGDGIQYSTQVVSVDYNTTNLKITSTELDTIQGISTGASPTFTGLTVSGLSSDRLISSVSGALTSADLDDWVAGTTNQVTVTDDTDGSITLSLPQNINTGASPTFAYVTLSNAPTGASHATNKAYVDGLIEGLHWQDSVLDRYDPTSETPVGPGTGDRYISTATANGWNEHDIYEYTGSEWDEVTAVESMTAYVKDEDFYYMFNGTIWVTMDTKFVHNNISSMQGGTSDEYYHLTSARHTILTGIADLSSTNSNFIVGSAGGWVAESGNTARTSLGVGTGDSPTFTGLTLSGLSDDRLISSVSGVLGSTDLYSWVTETANQVLIADDADGTITFSLPQSIHTGASPTFAGATIGSVIFPDVITDNNDPTGFQNRTDSTIVWSDSTPDRTLTIDDVSGSFIFYHTGIKFTKSSPETIQIDDTEGLWFIYYNSSGTLVATQSYSSTFITAQCLVAFVYWDATNNLGWLYDERHGYSMSGGTHLYLHETVGCAYESGLGLTDILAEENGGLNTHAQFGVALGEVHDEDNEHDINAIAYTTGLTVFYLDSTDWRWDTQSGYSFLTTTTRPDYNSSGTRVEVGVAQFFLIHVFATSGENGDPVAIMGQAEYATIGAARDGADTEILALALSGLPAPEFKAIGTVIFQAGAYANDVDCRIRATDTGDDYVDWREAALIGGGGVSSPATDHGALSGLGDDDHPQYLLADSTRALTNDWDAGAFEIRAQTFESDVTTGTPPFVIASTTVSTNLNADLWDGYEFATYLDQTLLQANSPTFNDLTISVPVNIYSLSHDSFADYESDEHFTQASITTLGTVTSGDIDTIANYYTDSDVDSHLSGGTGITYSTGAIALDLNELTTSTADADGDYFAVVDTGGAQKKLTKGSIALSGFYDDLGAGGTVVSVGAGNGMDFTTITATGNVILGTPGTTTQGTSNAVSATSHTHAWTHTSSSDWDSAYSHIHNLTTDIDHNDLTNTHNLSTDIDHDGLTNTHNMTTDIDARLSGGTGIAYSTGTITLQLRTLVLFL